MRTRKPIAAGQFYPGQYDSCMDEINQCLEQGTISVPLPQMIVAGIVPHAGWIFSGALAAMVFSAIKQCHEKVHTFVVFGAAHGYFGRSPAVYDKGSWLTPLGEIAVDEDMAGAIVDTGEAVSNPNAHDSEHSIEVQIPFIQHLFPGAKILPILAPPVKQVIDVGTSIGEIINKSGQKKVVCIGSTDLTHYGPGYGFVPMGTGREALDWAYKVNDRKFIDLALKLDSEGLLKSAADNGNACGPGAAAATLAAAKMLGKEEGVLLAHTNSSEVMFRKMGTASRDSVGYAAIIF